MVCKQYIVLNHVLSEKNCTTPQAIPQGPFPSPPNTFPKPFPAAFPARFSKLDADWLAPHHSIPSANHEESNF